MAYVVNIEEETLKNKDFRRVLYTTANSQLVLMSLKPKEEIGEETHKLDQFIRVEAGKGKAVLDGKEFNLSDGFSVVVPKGTRHNIINTSPDKEMKIYTVYSPPVHRIDAVHKTKADAEADKYDESEEA